MQTEIPFEKELKRQFWKEHECSPKKKGMILMTPQMDERFWGGYARDAKQKL